MFSSRKKIFARAFFIAGLSVVFASIGLLGNNAEGSEDRVFRVSFRAPVSIEQLFLDSETAGIRPVMLQASFAVGDIPYADFYLVPNGASTRVQNIARGYSREREQYIETLEMDLINIQRDGPPEASARAASTLAEVRKYKKEPSTIKIDAAIVSGTMSDLERSALRIERIERMDRNSSESETEAGSSALQSTAAADPKTWVPKEGYSITGSIKNSGRYVRQLLWWNDTTGLGYLSTYEHEFALNNNDGKTYLSRKQTINGFPLIQYASASLPKPYLDTRIGDPATEPQYTIGSAEASRIVPRSQYWYDTYIAMAAGNANSDNAKLQAQLGYRSPVDCYTTWCSNGRSDVPIVRIIPAWGVKVPSSQYWSR